MRFNSLSLLFIILFTSCQQADKKRLTTKYENIHISDSIKANDDITSVIQPYRKKIEKEMNEKLAYSSKAIYKSDYPLNTPIGNLMADAVLEMSNPIFKRTEQKKVDAVLLNYGGIRAGINKGKVSVRTAFNIMPFENQVIIAELRSSSVKKMIDYLVKQKRAHPVAGMQIVLDQNGDLKSASINNQPIKKGETYHIATSDYLFRGGDDMQFFAEAVSSYDIDYKLRNLFIDYFRKQDTLPVIHDNRFIQK